MLHVAERWRDLFAALKIHSCEAAAAHFLGEKSTSPGVCVVEREIDRQGTEENLFFKQYYYAPASWRFWGRASKAAREVSNARQLRQLGMAVPEVICWGEERDAIGRLRRGIIATVAVPRAAMLPDFLKASAQRRDPETRKNRRMVLQELAESVRRMHTAGFYHHDLVGRNLLYSDAAGDAPRLWWIDCPRGAYDHWSPGRGRKRLRDLAGLDKTGAQFCSRTERLRWLLAYLGLTKLSASDKLLARRIIDYRLAH